EIQQIQIEMMKDIQQSINDTKN
ncbi:MAG: hypothetical protein RJB36_67, partial [Bacteroidota bacterium]